MMKSYLNFFFQNREASTTELNEYLVKVCGEAMELRQEVLRLRIEANECQCSGGGGLRWRLAGGRGGKRNSTRE